MYFSREQFASLCRIAGVTIEQASACVDAESEDGYHVNPGHPSFPHPRKGWGDHVAAGLSAVGITKERVSKLVGRDCGCAKRQAALNAIGQKVTDFLRGTDGEKLDDKTD